MAAQLLGLGGQLAWEFINDLNIAWNLHTGSVC